MNQEIFVERLFSTLITGDRTAARDLAREAIDSGMSAEWLSHQAYWPVIDMVNNLYRADQLSNLAHHYAIRVLRSLISQTQPLLARKSDQNRSILMFSGHSEADELAGQLTADLVEAEGYNITFGGGGIAYDEILAEVGERKPDVLLMFASAPSDAPIIRQLIDTIREIGACPNMQIVVGGGVFNRAEGLAEEIGADLWAKDPGELISSLNSDANRRATATQRTVGRKRPMLKSEAA
ncbi:MAG TPA: B12-binding domain-containing protein [Phycisphaerales bacterium]|nr:B12-binding domain-containing protein [Phycisphaerales bacterium]